VTFIEFLEGRVNDYQQQVNLAAATRQMPEPYKGYSDLLGTMMGWSGGEDPTALVKLVRHFQSKERADLIPQLKKAWFEFRAIQMSRPAPEAPGAVLIPRLLS